VCLFGEVALLGIWKVVMNLLLAGLNLFHQPISLGLIGHCVDTIVGEEPISSFSSTMYFCWIEGVEVAVVVVAFCTSFEHILKRINFSV
jgi:hypothetical protein